MATSPPQTNQTAVRNRLVRLVLPTAPCRQCARPAPRVGEAHRTAIDIDLEQAVLVQVTVSVHRCASCQRYFRVQPPFLRPGATYTNRVVAKAVASVYQDGMAFTRVADRLARDFWVRPSERMIRLWCRAYTDRLNWVDDYQPWVVAEFSGVLCVDEVYQNRLALLLAVDPAAPDGDRLIGYELVHGAVQQADVTRLLARLREAGMMPDEVITDASPLYPAVLRTIWPAAAHQLCLFHETRQVTDAVAQVIQEFRATLPKAPTMQRRMGRIRNDPPPGREDVDRSYDRPTRVTLVQRLHQQGYSQRAIARLTGHSRMTISRWLREPPPGGAASIGADLSQAGTAGAAGMVPRDRPPPPSGPPAEAPLIDWRRRPAVPAPPAPWTNWEQVHAATEALRTDRFLLLRRPEHLREEEQARVERLLELPGGEHLRHARRFLEEWYAIPTAADGTRRTPEAALERWHRWRQQAVYRQLAPLRRVLDRMDAERAQQVLAFLRQPAWEATHNGAERGGRQFRHLQASCFTLRTTAAIDGALKAWAMQTKAVRTTRPIVASRSRRGRTTRHRDGLEGGSVAG